jgi:hypothetical protein
MLVMELSIENGVLVQWTRLRLAPEPRLRRGVLFRTPPGGVPTRPGNTGRVPKGVPQLVERVFRNLLLCQRSGHCAQIRPGRRWDETKRRSPCDPPLEIGLMRWFQNVITPGPHLGRGAPTQSINKTRIYEQNTRHPPGYDQAMHTASVRPARRLATWRDACEVVPKLRSLVSTSGNDIMTATSSAPADLAGG